MDRMIPEHPPPVMAPAVMVIMYSHPCGILAASAGGESTHGTCSTALGYATAASFPIVGAAVKSPLLDY
jgi:hypothetical protein